MILSRSISLFSILVLCVIRPSSGILDPANNAANVVPRIGAERRLIRSEQDDIDSSASHVKTDDIDTSASQYQVNLGDLMEQNNISFHCSKVSVSSWQSSSASEILRTFSHALSFAQHIGAHEVSLPVSTGLSSTILGAGLPTDSPGSIPQGTISIDEADIWRRRLGLDSLSHFDISYLFSGVVSTEGGVVTISGYNGQMGNRLYVLGSALVFASYVGATTLSLAGEFKYNDILNFTKGMEIPLTGLVRQNFSSQCAAVAKSVEKMPRKTAAMGWWYGHCNAVPASVHHDLFMKFVRPYFSVNLSTCVNTPATVLEEETLTVHYREADVEGGGMDTPRFDNPCTLVDRLRKEGGHKHLMVIAKTQNRKQHPLHHPCVQKFQTLVTNGDSSITMQNGSLVEDVCMMLRARHLLVSFSTFAEGLAILSDRLQTYYHAGEYEPFHSPKSVSFCTDRAGNLWPGTKLVQYERGRDYEKGVLQGLPFNETMKKVLLYPAEKFNRTGTADCDHVRQLIEPIKLPKEAVQKKDAVEVAAKKGADGVAAKKAADEEAAIKAAGAAARKAAEEAAAKKAADAHFAPPPYAIR